jgi:hypothetical protein
VHDAEPLHILLFLLLMMRMGVSLEICSPSYVLVLISGWQLPAAGQCRAANGEPCLQLLSGGWCAPTVGHCNASAHP